MRCCPAVAGWAWSELLRICGREPVGLPHHRHAADDVRDINIRPLLSQQKNNHGRGELGMRLSLDSRARTRAEGFQVFSWLRLSIKRRIRTRLPR